MSSTERFSLYHTGNDVFTEAFCLMLATLANFPVGLTAIAADCVSLCADGAFEQTTEPFGFGLFINLQH